MKGQIKCQCCGKGTLVTAFRKRLELAEVYAGFEFEINSGFRCPRHNGVVGGSVTSSHLVGRAVDIKNKDDDTRCRLIKSLLKAGFNRMGFGKTFIHTDDDPYKNSHRFWVY